VGTHIITDPSQNGILGIETTPAGERGDRSDAEMGVFDTEAITETCLRDLVVTFFFLTVCLLIVILGLVSILSQWNKESEETVA
jgi:hypothetical protein